MRSVYGKNGLLSFDSRWIFYREWISDMIIFEITRELLSINRAFDIRRIECPILTPNEMIDSEYNRDNMFSCSSGDGLVLRPETTAGSYAYAQSLIKSFEARLPLVVYQHGKSFRNEQDKVTANMRLKEFYQLEFQVLYSPTTKCDYGAHLRDFVCQLLSSVVGKSKLVQSDRLPKYSKNTVDVACDGMELCSMSNRTDFSDAENFEIAIGTDRCVYKFLRQKDKIKEEKK